MSVDDGGWWMVVNEGDVEPREEKKFGEISWKMIVIYIYMKI
jgi:hypothetical protein